MEFKQGWTYAYSEELKQWLALHNKSGWMYCEDGVKYSPRELAILHTTYGDKPMPWQVHTIKKVFGGEIQENKAATIADWQKKTAKPAALSAPQTPSTPPAQKPVQADDNEQHYEFDIF